MLEDTFQHKGLRKKLIEEIRRKGIKDERVLNALMAVPRHWFLDSVFLQHAYQDKAFPIEEGQTISQPYTVAFQTELLQLQPNQSVLEIGTGSAYQACILAEMGVKVYTIEYNEILFKKARRMIDILRYDKKVQCFLGDGSQGLPRFAPYDAILVTAGAPAVPESLLFQLKIGGRLVIPVGDNKTQKMMRIIRKNEKQFTQEEFENFSFVPLLGKNGWQIK
ncbi:MAG: protein-L-isoaspartate(D-aspartate) O-methyltransferase [Raineya sp.]|nr:protein-L-isoaspartate(D-aspartate) O-methyltransferase [Raineya sp.]MDW8295254.1 protein-L-isoaspartate(D-aspartate) O-methyltransferase [Raineya sp.]